MSMHLASWQMGWSRCMDGIQKEVMPEQNWQTWKKRSFPAGGIA
jgi:hypothetical protein